MALTPKQKAFAAAYLATGSLTDALAAQEDPAKVAAQELVPADDPDGTWLVDSVAGMGNKYNISSRQARFAKEYFVCGSADLAYVRAGFGTAQGAYKGYHLLKHPGVIAYLQELERDRAAQPHMSANNVLEALEHLGESDVRELFHSDGAPKTIHELPTKEARAIKSVKTYRRKTGAKDPETGEPIYETVNEFTFWDKPSAITAMAKYHGILADRSEIDPSAEETRAVRRALRQKMLMELGNNAKPVPPTLNPDGSDA